MNETAKKEIGGYIELDTYRMPMLHSEAISLNCGRNALAYILRAKRITKLCVPFFICDSVPEACKREGVEVSHYHIGYDFKPIDVSISDDEWLYIVNYYGQLSNEELLTLKNKYKRVIVDQAQSYFQMPPDNTDTLYSCRKYFGVSDGAFLYTDVALDEEIPQDESFDRMTFLLGRYERAASEFLEEYRKNNRFFRDEPIKTMSKLTNNLLHGIDYEYIEHRRKQNFSYLDDALRDINLLNIQRTGTFMYPFMVEDGEKVREKLRNRQIYIPVLWPEVVERMEQGKPEYQLSSNLLPLPCDQRYGEKEMMRIVREINECLRN